MDNSGKQSTVVLYCTYGTYSTNIASVHLVMGCPNARTSVKIVKKEPSEQPKATKSTPSLIATSAIAVGVALVVPILVGYIYILKSNVCVCVCVCGCVSGIHGRTVGPILPKFCMGSSFSKGAVIGG